MDNFETNSIKIANYLEDRMEAAEEEGFMRELSEDAELREQYEEVLMVQTLLHPGESADGYLFDAGHGSHSATVYDLHDSSTSGPPDSSTVYDLHGEEGPISDEGRGKVKEIKRTPVIQFLHRYRMVAAVVGVIVIGSTVFLVTGRKGDGSIGTAVGTLSQKGNAETDSIFQEYYTPYQNDSVPAALSTYYAAYRQGDYTSVINAQPSDYGATDNSGGGDLLQEYMFLYKGLSYLALDQKEEAIRELEVLLGSNPKVINSYYAAQWYVALALIKNYEPQKAISLLQDITKTSSPYNLKAVQLLARLNSR